MALDQGEAAARAQAHDDARMVCERLASRHSHEAQPDRLFHRRAWRGLDNAAVGRECRVEGRQRIAIRSRIADQRLDPGRIVGETLRQTAHPQPAGQTVEPRVFRRQPSVDEDQGRPFQRIEGAGLEIGRQGLVRRGRRREFQLGERCETGVLPSLHARARQPVGAEPPAFIAQRIEPRQARAPAVPTGRRRVPGSRTEWSAGRAWPAAPAQAAALGSSPRPA